MKPYNPFHPRCPHCGEPVIQQLYYKSTPVLVCNCVPNDFLMTVAPDGKQTLRDMRTKEERRINGIDD